MKIFLIRLKREILIYTISFAVVSIIAAATYLIVNPIVYTVSANLAFTDLGKEFIIKDGLAEEPSKILQYNADAKFTLSQDYKNLIITVKGENPSKITKIANDIAERYKSEFEKNAPAVVYMRHTKQLNEIDNLISNHTAQLSRIKVDLDEIESKFRILKKQYNSTEEARNALQSRLSALLINRDNLLRVYTESHPEVISIDFEISSLKNKLENLPVIEGLESLERSLNAQKSTYNDIQQGIVALEQQKNNLQEETKKPLVNINSYAITPVIPIGDANKQDIYKRFILSAVLLGLIISSVTAAFKDTIISEANISNVPDLPLIATIPFIKPKKKQKNQKHIAYGPKSIGTHLLFYYDDSSDYVDAYRSLATHIKLDAFKGNIDKKVMLVTSPENKSGKSTICANLAITLARSGKRVILLDANLNRRSVAKFFGMGAKVIGISDIISGKAKLEDCIKDVTDMLLSGDLKLDTVVNTHGLDRLKILSSGLKIANFADLLESKEMEELFKQLRQQFDCIVVDSPGLLKSPDALVISPNTDAIFLVSRTNHTSYKDVLKCSKKLTEAKVQFKGIILICT